MKRVSVVVVMLLVAGLLAACGGGGGGTGTPEGAAKAFFEAIAKGDVNKLKSLWCEELTANMDETDWESLADAPESVDLSALKFKTVDSSGDNATVQVTGLLKYTWEGESQEENMDETMLMVKENGQWKFCDPNW